MPIKTEHYGLEAFNWSDNYSAAADKRRFTIIDSQLAFITDIIGEGIISGWDIELNSDGEVIVNSGIGIIGRKIVRTFGTTKLDDILENVRYYLYMQKKSNLNGGDSGHSNIVNISGEDTIPPSEPDGLKKVSSIENYLSQLDSYTEDFITYIKRLMDITNIDDQDFQFTLIPYSQIAFSWDQNTEEDFSHYVIYRMDDYGRKEYWYCVVEKNLTRW